jgi:hypothetical protein
MRYTVDRSKVVYETIEGEAILIHLETGFYYSLDGSGSEIWDLVADGRTRDEISAGLRRRYDAPPGAVEEAVDSLVGRLLEEGLVVEVEGSGNGSAPSSAGDDLGDGGGRTEFVEPVLHRYTDMADFMLVDPIHEVGEAGWPQPQAAP